MNFLQLVAPIVSNPMTIYAVVGLLAAWAIVSLVVLRVKTERLVRALNRATAELASAGGSAGFPGAYAKIDAELASSPVLGSRWRAFRETLVIPRRPGKPVHATGRPSEWFDLGLLRAPGISLDPRYHAAMPNLLVGAGLLFTFLGLAVALGSASGVVSGAADQRNQALETLLSTASFKFITSLAGMFLSIIYALWRKSRMHAVERALDRFLSSLDEVAPRITPIALQLEQIELLESQATYLEGFSNDLAISIGSAIDNTFNERLAEHIGPLGSAIDRLSANLSTSNEDAMKQMLEAFLGKLEGGAGDHMRGVAEQLSELGGQLGGLQEGLGQAAARMSDSADAMAKRMGEGAEAALSRITDQMGGLAESLRAVADQTRETSAQAGGAMAEKIEAAALSFEQAAARTADTLADAAAKMEQRMGEQASESSARLTGQLEAMLARMSELAESSRRTGADAFGALAQQVGQAAATFEATAASISEALKQAATDTGGAFGKGAEDAVGRIAEATEGMRDEMKAVLAELQAAVGAAGQSLRAGGTETASILRGALGEASESMASSLATAARQVAEAGASAGTALERGGSEASGRIIDASGAFGGRAEGLAAQVAQLAAAAEALAQRTTAFERAAATATEPLSTSAADLKAAGQAMRAAVDPLAEMSKAVTRAIEQVAGTVQRLQAAAESAGQLSGSLDQAARRFEGVDRELAATLGALQNGLQGFTKQVSEFVVRTDQNLAQAVTRLQASVSSLDETLEDYAPAGVAGRR